MQQLAGAVEAHRLPAPVQLDAFEHALAALAARHAVRTEPDRTAGDPALVAAPAATAAQLVDARSANLAIAHRSVVGQPDRSGKFSATLPTCRRRARSST